jgi:hypothetical protein
MGHDTFTALKRGSSTGLPASTIAKTTTTRGRTTASRGKQIKRTFNNLKLTILCGFVTILVLPSTIGIGNLTGSPDADGDARKIAEETNRILAEIPSDDEPSDPNGSKGTCQWSLDLLDAWASLGPKGLVRDLYFLCWEKKALKAGREGEERLVEQREMMNILILYEFAEELQCSAILLSTVAPHHFAELVVEAAGGWFLWFGSTNKPKGLFVEPTVNALISLLAVIKFIYYYQIDVPCLYFDKYIYLYNDL